jgi:HK97 family phage prohead protease
VDLKSVQFKADDVDNDTRIFKGYASTYDKDLGGDIILPGAFAKTLSERADRVKVLWQHNEPIGRPVKMYEDGKGLYVEAKISKTRLGDEALELMRDGVIDQMSIGYSVPSGKADYDEDGNRLIKELKLYEFSAVTFPMNEKAFITGVKSVREALQHAKAIDENSIAELKRLVDDLTALLAQEPPKGTPNVSQPPEIDALLKSIENFGR